MALVNKVWRESLFVPPGGEPGLTMGHNYFENVQGQAVGEIAAARFAYPTKAEPHLKTYLNRPEHTVGVRVPSGDLLFPDIVVMDTTNTAVYVIGEVETSRSLRAADVMDKWQAFAAVGLLYVFVPYTETDRARRMLKARAVRLGGLRAWRHNLGLGGAEVVDIAV